MGRDRRPRRPPSPPISSRSATTAIAAAMPLLLGAGLLLVAAQVASAEPILAAPSRVKQGDAITILLSDAKGVTAGFAEIAGPEGAVIERAPIFPLPPEDPTGAVGSVPTGNRWAALLGVPSDLAPGGYDLRISADHASGTVDLERPLRVEAGDFAHEEIPLSAALTELRERPSPEREAQAREYWRIITAFHPADLFQEGPLRDPLVTWIVTAPFGERRVYRYANGKTSADLHYGIDMAAPLGTPVYAAGRGRVAFAGAWLLTGNSVVIEHLPGVYSSYFHLRTILVKEGDLVAQGQEIGTVGETGLATGPHLHWQITVAGVPVSPDRLLHAALIDKSASSTTIVDQRPKEGGDFHRLREN